MKKENENHQKVGKQLNQLIIKAHAQPGVAELMEVVRRCEETFAKAKIYYDLDRDDLKSISATHTY